MRVKRMWFNEPLHINIFHTNITTYYSLCGNVTLGIGRYSYPQHLVSLLEVSRTVETSGGGATAAVETRLSPVNVTHGHRNLFSRMWFLVCTNEIRYVFLITT